MAIVVLCPNCRTRLTLGDDRAGKTFHCPRCDAAMSVPVPAAPPAVPPPPPRALPVPAPVFVPTYPDPEPTPPPRRRGDELDPDRGAMVLVFGILSLILCAPLGIVAWVMGANDLNEMRAGRMDRSGYGTTQAGYVCGIIGTVLFVVALIPVCLWFTLVFAFVGAR